MPEESLTVRMAGAPDGVSAEGFLDVLRDTLATLQEVDKQASEFGAITLDWLVVDAGLKSPLFATLQPRPLTGKGGDHGRRVITAYVSGLAHLANNQSPPALFSERAIRLAAGLVRVYAKGVTSIEVSMNGHRAVVTKQVAQNANAAVKQLELARAKQSGQSIEYGTIEGQLKELAVQSGRDKMIIVDSLTSHETRCYIRSHELEDKARMYWKYRVAASGEITSDRLTGDPIEMLVDDIYPLRDRSNLPQIDDIIGIDITGGIESSEYVASLRDDN